MSRCRVPSGAGWRGGERRLRCAGILALALASPLWPGSAAAHTRSLSYSTWKLDARGAEVRSRVSRLDLTRLGLDPVSSPEDAARAALLLAGSLRLTAGGHPCPPVSAPAPLPAPDGWLVHAWRVECASSGPRHLESSLLLEAAPSHLHFVRVEEAGGRILDQVLSESAPGFDLEPAPAPRAPAPSAAAAGNAGVGRYFSLGVQHILSGWDHLAFVGALLLLAATLRELAALVSAFTLAHSVTLALAATGHVTPRAPAVEALIGFSIALAAAENAWILGGRDRLVPWIATAALGALAAVGAPALPRFGLLGLALFTACHFALLARSQRPARLRVAIAFVFGLVHGMGFAGVLAELALPAGHLLPALFGFNLGVEAGQLLVVGLTWPALRLLDRLPAGRPLGPRTAEVASAAICGLGVFWFAVRLLGS